MDTLRITTISFLAAFALAGCAQEEDESDAIGANNLSSGALELRAPAAMQKEATGVMTVFDLGNDQQAINTALGPIQQWLRSLAGIDMNSGVSGIFPFAKQMLPIFA